MAALEEQRSLLIIAVGVRGIAAARAALKWTPVQAHATTQKVRGMCLLAPETLFALFTRLTSKCDPWCHPPPQVTCLYVTRSPSTAAFLPEWDLWRDAGVSNDGRSAPCRCCVHI